jgi:hypothetical protein
MKDKVVVKGLHYIAEAIKKTAGDYEAKLRPEIRKLDGSAAHLELRLARILKPSVAFEHLIGSSAQASMSKQESDALDRMCAELGVFYGDAAAYLKFLEVVEQTEKYFASMDSVFKSAPGGVVPGPKVKEAWELDEIIAEFDRLPTKITNAANDLQAAKQLAAQGKYEEAQNKTAAARQVMSLCTEAVSAIRQGTLVAIKSVHVC